jgi:hypothetical protein
VVILRSVLLRTRNVTDKSCTENQNTYFVYSIFFFENRAVCDILWEKKYGIARQATDDNMARALCIMGNYGYRHAVRICNTYCFSTTTMVARTGRNVTLYGQ